MFEPLVRRFANHLLDGEAWARAHLRPFAGKHARFEWGPLALTMSIGQDGTLLAADPGQACEVCIRLPDDTPFRMLAQPESVFAAAHLSGAADFAEALGFVFRNLRWDAEADLARLTGDVLARRSIMAVQAFSGSRREAARRLGENLAEYAADEAGWIMRPASLRARTDEIRKLEDDVARLEARIARLH